MSAPLDGLTALVTGAHRGIGRAIAMALADAGAAVAAADVLDPRPTAEAIAARGGQALAVPCNVAEEADVLDLFARLDQAWPRLDIAVACAGIIDERPLLETTAADFDRVIGVNLRGTFFTGREALRRMARQAGGRLIAIASDLGQSGRETFSAYVASKHAVIGLTRCWAREFAPHVLVNAICPGPIDTAMLDAGAMSPEWRQRELAIPLGRFGAPEEVAAMAVFLAGPGGAYITGQSIGVNGGSVMV